MGLGLGLRLGLRLGFSNRHWIGGIVVSVTPVPVRGNIIRDWDATPFLLAVRRLATSARSVPKLLIDYRQVVLFSFLFFCWSFFGRRFKWAVGSETTPHRTSHVNYSDISLSCAVIHSFFFCSSLSFVRFNPFHPTKSGLTFLFLSRHWKILGGQRVNTSLPPSREG